MFNHCIRAQQWDKNQLDSLFRDAHFFMRDITERDSLIRSILHGKIMATLFYEPSTRTRLSFESAMLSLGGEVITAENAREFSSAIKGETLEDSIRVVGGYADIIVIRHFEAGAAERAAAVSTVPIINAGDGAGQHPTQALLDLFTIQDELGAIDGITIAMVGDLLNGRTVRSLSYLLGKNYHVKKIYLVAPEPVRMKADIKNFLTNHRVPFEETPNLYAVLPDCDVVYQTRIQKERFGDRIADYTQASGIYVITPDSLARMKKRSIVMHPLPRNGEITDSVDNDPRAAYFRQARNGRFVRMALLKKLLIEK